MLFLVAWLSFVLPIALIGDAASEAANAVTHADVVAVPIARSATTVEDAPVGRASRSATHFPALACDAATLSLDIDDVACVRLRSTTISFALDPRVAPYDATAPPTLASVA